MPESTVSIPAAAIADLVEKFDVFYRSVIGDGDHPIWLDMAADECRDAFERCGLIRRPALVPVAVQSRNDDVEF